MKDFKIQLQGTVVERKGRLAFTAEVFEATSKVAVVESEGEELGKISEKK